MGQTPLHGFIRAYDRPVPKVALGFRAARAVGNSELSDLMWAEEGRRKTDSEVQELPQAEEGEHRAKGNIDPGDLVPESFY